MKIIKSLVAFAITMAIALPATGASADEGPGTFALETAEPLTTSVRYVVRLTFTGDGHPARDATVTATAIDSDGTARTPVAMPPVDRDGRYEATVTFPAPGEWTVRFTAVLPPATMEQPQTITAPPSSTPESTTTTPISDATETTNEPESTAEETSGSSDDEGFSWPFFGIGIVAVVAVGARVLARRAGS